MALKIIEHEPADGGVSAPEESISLYFSNDVDTDSLDTSKIKLFDDQGPVLYDYDYNQTERELVIDPTSYFTDGSEITVIVKEDIASLSGEEMPGKYTFDFRVEGNDELAVPTIIDPKDWDTLSELTVELQTVKDAETYELEVAENEKGLGSRENFERNKVYSTTVMDSGAIQRNLDGYVEVESADGTMIVNLPDELFEYGSEYLVRARARDMVYDGEDTKFILENESLTAKATGIGDNNYRISLSEDYSPILEADSVLVQTYGGQSFRLNSDYFYPEDEYTSELILDLSEVGLAVSEIEQAVLEFQYGVSREASDWSPEVGFYYEESVSLSEQLSSLLEDQVKEEIELLKPEKFYNTTLDTVEIKVPAQVELADINLDVKVMPLNGYMFIDVVENYSFEKSLKEESDSYKIFEFTPNKNAPENNEIKLRVDIPSYNLFEEYYFITTINPLYSGYKTFTGSQYSEFIEEYKERSVYIRIFENSLDFQDLIEEYELDIDFTEGVPRLVNSFVYYNTLYDLVFGAIMTQSQSSSFTLGDYSIEYTDQEEIRNYLDDIEDKIDMLWEKIIDQYSDMEKNLPTTFQKGSYPFETRREF